MVFATTTGIFIQYMPSTANYPRFVHVISGHIQAGATLRHLWEPCHEARRVEKLAEFARIDLDPLLKASKLADDAAHKVPHRVGNVEL